MGLSCSFATSEPVLFDSEEIETDSAPFHPEAQQTRVKIQRALFTFSIQNENRLYNDDSLNVTMTLLKFDKNKYI